MPGVRKLYSDSNGNLQVLKDTTSVVPPTLLGSGIGASKLSPGTVEAEYNSGAQSITLGVSSAYGATVNFTPGTGFYQIEPTQIVVTWGGTFSTETANIQIVATFSDTTTATLTVAGVSSTGTQTLNTNDLATILVTKKNIVSFTIAATTTHATSTTVTCSVTATGTQSQ